MISYKWTTAIIALGIATKILLLIRKDVLHASYAVWWLFVAGSILLAGIFPKFIDQLAAHVGVSYPPMLFVVLGVGLMLVKMLTMDLDRSRQEQNIRRLVQRIAMLEAKKVDTSS